MDGPENRQDAIIPRTQQCPNYRAHETFFVSLKLSPSVINKLRAKLPRAEAREPRTFPMLGLLPPELRNIIWRYAAYAEDRIVKVVINLAIHLGYTPNLAGPLSPSFRSKSTLILLLVNKEAGNGVRKIYNRTGPGTRLISPETDIYDINYPFLGRTLLDLATIACGSQKGIDEDTDIGFEPLMRLYHPLLAYLSDLGFKRFRLNCHPLGIRSLCRSGLSVIAWALGADDFQVYQANCHGYIYTVAPFKDMSPRDPNWQRMESLSQRMNRFAYTVRNIGSHQTK
ncbi:hypothetical protein F5Y16DRAFT_15700 [Xylariaceae sp. FL0255]|nr:hypothetical protein F5Y16DRAFT_15700 [Xylariaceae sp. FL0255]